MLGLVWAAASALVALDPTGAGGAVDCWPECSLYQEAVKAARVLPPALLLVLLVAGAVLLATSAAQRRDGRDGARSS